MTEKTINRNKQKEKQTFPFIQVLLKYFNSLSPFPQELQPEEVDQVNRYGCSPIFSKDCSKGLLRNIAAGLSSSKETLLN
jgi:hypothetical protein